MGKTKRYDFEDWEAERMKDPEFRAACEELEPAYEAEVALLEVAEAARAYVELDRLCPSPVLEYDKLVAHKKLAEAVSVLDKKLADALDVLDKEEE